MIQLYTEVTGSWGLSKHIDDHNESL